MFEKVLRFSFFARFLVGLPLFVGLMAQVSEAQNVSPSWENISLREDLYFRRQQELMLNEPVSEANRLLLEEIQNYQPRSQTRAEGVDFNQAQQIIDLTKSNPITGWAGNSKYDPRGTLGFCFGRALYAHLELLRHGVSKDSIKKVFIVGPMKSGGVDWQFHVATIVRAKDRQGWYAMDTFVGKVLPVEEWFKRFQGYSTDNKLRLYITEPTKIGPSSWEYNIQQGGLFDKFYNGYFEDLFKYFRKNPLPEDKKFIRECGKVFR